MISVFKPSIGKEEINAVIDALKKGEISGSFGGYIPKFEDLFAHYVGCEYGVAVTSGTTALHLAIASLNLPRGSEVLVSASTNIATALAAIHNNCVPVSVDSEPLTWNLNLDLIEKLITKRTRAIISVHIYGHPVDMDRLMKLAKKYNLYVVEDCAESHGATVRGKMTGSFGDMGCFSFYANKIITTGEGGMVTTNNKKFAEKLRLLRNLAFMKPRFFHQLAGYNFRMTGYQAAMGVAQMKKIKTIINDKRRVAHLYNKYLGNVSGLQLPYEAEWAKNVYWMYGIVLNKKFNKSRDAVVEYLHKQGIETRSFFCPIGDQPCVKSLDGYRRTPIPVARKLWKNGMYLPSSSSLSERSIKFIASKIIKFQSQ